MPGSIKRARDEGTSVKADSGSKRINFGSTVEIIVGSEKKVFTVHKDVLCNDSDFFKAAFGGNWRETSTASLSLPEDNPEVFSLCLQWAYTKDAMPDLDEKLELGQLHWPTLALIKLYILADKLQTTTPLQKAIFGLLQKTHTKSKMIPNSGYAKIAFDKTRPGSDLREWFLYHYVHNVTVEDAFTESNVKANPAFYAEVLQRAAKVIRGAKVLKTFR